MTENEGPTSFEQIKRMPRFTAEQSEQKIMENTFAEVPPVDDARYDKPLKPEIEGRKVIVNYGGKNVSYLVPSNYAWTAGVGAITIGKAFRIFDEGKATEHLREVRDSSELESAASGYFQKIIDLLKNRR